MFFQGSQPSMVKNSIIIKHLAKFRQVNCPGLRVRALRLNSFRTFICPKYDAQQRPLRHIFAIKTGFEMPSRVCMIGLSEI